VSGYYDEDEERWIDFPEEIDNLAARFAAASVREDWQFAKKLLNDAHLKWRAEGGRDQQQAQRDALEEEERRRLRYRNAYEVCFETLDGIQGVGEISFNPEGPRPLQWKRACRREVHDLTSVESMERSIPIRTYEFEGHFDRAGRPIYKEILP
jgi:hypothetical protein